MRPAEEWSSHLQLSGHRPMIGWSSPPEETLAKNAPSCWPPKFPHSSVPTETLHLPDIYILPPTHNPMMEIRRLASHGSTMSRRVDGEGSPHSRRADVETAARKQG